MHNLAKPDLGCGELRLCLNKPPHLHASFLKAPCALTWGPAEKCSFSWRSQLIFYNCIQLDNHLRPGLANLYSRGPGGLLRLLAGLPLSPNTVVQKPPRPVRKGMGMTVCGGIGLQAPDGLSKALDTAQLEGPWGPEKYLQKEPLWRVQTEFLWTILSSHRRRCGRRCVCRGC